MNAETRKLNIIREVLDIDDESTLDALMNLLGSLRHREAEIQKSDLLNFSGIGINEERALAQKNVQYKLATETLIAKLRYEATAGTHLTYSVEEVLAVGGATEFGRIRGQNNKTLIDALENAPEIEPFTDEEWEDLMAEMKRDK